MRSIFEFKDYKRYLLHIISENGHSITELAEAASCQRSYLSRVINGKLQLTPDHAFGISEFLRLNSDERRGFQLLVEIERAAQKTYKDHLKKEYDICKNQYLELKNRVSNLEIINSETNTNYNIYYSSWIYAAIHIACSVPSLQTVESLSARFQLHPNEVLAALTTLERMSLIQKDRHNKWIWKSGDMHLPRENPLITAFHQNWLFKSQMDIQRQRRDSLHFSAVHSISQEDYELISQKIVEWISQYSKVATPSKPEEIICFRIDYFKL